MDFILLTAQPWMIQKKTVIFYTEILTRKVVLWYFSTSEMSEKNPQFNFLSQNLSKERNFFKMRWKSNQDMTPTFPQNLEKKYIGIYNQNNFGRLPLLL